MNIFKKLLGIKERKKPNTVKHIYGEVHIKTKKSLIVSERYIKYIQCMADDKSNKEIAAELNISIRTIETYWYRCQTLFGVTTKTGLVALLLRENLIK